MSRSFVAAVAFAGLMIAPCASAAAQGVAVDSTPCVGVAGRDSGEARRQARPDSVRAAPAAVMLFAAASAREITFVKAPEVRVRLCGGLDSLRVVERRNIPQPIVAGRTYRDVYVAVEIFARLDAECVVAALTSAPADSSGRRNACASLEIGGTRTRPPND